MSNIAADRLMDEFEDRISGSLADIVNPGGAVGSVAGETEGIFGCENWERYTSSRLAAISTAVAVLNDNIKEGESFYKGVLDYVASKVGAVFEAQLAAANHSAARVSHCQEGAAGRAELYHQLKDDGFFGRLKPAYATLEILTSMILEYSESLPSESIEILQKHLAAQEARSAQEMNAGGAGQKFKRKQYQSNKYRALSQFCDEGYRVASGLLSGLDIASIKRAISDKKIIYRNPL